MKRVVGRAIAPLFTRARIALGVLFVLFAIPRSARADDFFGSSPGPLTSSHAALDTQARCADCHVGDSKELANDRCLACHDHKDLGAKIAAGKGFHASALVKGKKCESCHHEHKGKAYDVMGWSSIKGGTKGFDHDVTGWQLKGKHAATECKDCHKDKNKQGLTTYMGTDRLCGSCHAKDQPHKFERKDMLACERCHNESVWKPSKGKLDFNHDDRKDTAMPLLGSHRDVACVKCHTKNVFNLPFPKPDSCGNAGCHQSPHDGHIFGARPCEWCHSPTFKTLKNIQVFDHSERTRFDLGPGHRKLKCEQCHTKALGEAKPNRACEVCHAKDSHHGDRFNEFGTPPKCETCHTSGALKFTPNAFNHNTRTKFELKFKHAEQSCRGCHRGGSPSDFEKFNFNPNKECMSCHAHAKVHRDDAHPNGKYKNSECLECHIDTGSPKNKPPEKNDFVKKVHGPTGTFPLIKGHKTVPCAKCHTGRDDKGKTSFSALKPDCNAAGQCHEDSLHKGTLGNTCLGCHSAGLFAPADGFDHDKPFPADAKGKVKAFPLKGEHKKNDCASCHPQRKYVEAGTTCSAQGCHLEDDAHKGRLGDKCEKCHVETGDNTFNHNTMSAFKLDGKHLTVRCLDCHPSVTFKPRPSDCFGCHPEPVVHKGQYGTGCAQCHTTRTWGDVKPLHDVGEFALRGMHDNIACERCHRDSRPLAGSGNLCINCHRQDDIHNNSLSPRCGDCHTQWSFVPARFDHTKVGCNLTGVHRTVACFDCHKSGNFAGLTPQCAGCHHDDAVKATAFYVNHPTVAGCASCHNPNTWLFALSAAASPAKFDRESVCR